MQYRIFQVKLSFFYKAFLLLVVVFGISGCLESSFKLSDESRLPKWFFVSVDVDRKNISVQMDLYSTVSGGKAVFKLYEKDKLVRSQKYTITSDEQPDMRSVQLRSSPEGFPSGYPRYKVVTINGVTDIIELRKMEPVFYMTDDPAVWKELGVEQKR
jgi:hypothetical protein